MKTSYVFVFILYFSVCSIVYASDAFPVTSRTVKTSHDFMVDRWEHLPFKDLRANDVWVNHVNTHLNPSNEWNHYDHQLIPFYRWENGELSAAKCLSYSASSILDWHSIQSGKILFSYNNILNNNLEFGINPREIESVYLGRIESDPEVYSYKNLIFGDPITYEPVPYNLKGYSTIMTNPPKDWINKQDPSIQSPTYRHTIDPNQYLDNWHYIPVSPDDTSIKNALKRYGILYAQLETFFYPVHAVALIGYQEDYSLWRDVFWIHETYDEEYDGDNTETRYKGVYSDDISSIFAFYDPQWPTYHHDYRRTGFTMLRGDLKSESEVRKTKWTLNEDHNPSAISHPSIADLDGDGEMEVIVTTSSYEEPVGGKVYAVRKKRSGFKEVWVKDIGTPIAAAPTIADVNGDGVKDVVFGTRDMKLYVLDGNNGEELWVYQTEEKFSRIYESYYGGDLGNTAVMDIDDKPGVEIIFTDAADGPSIYDWPGELYILDHNGNLKTKRELGNAGAFGAPAIANVDDDEHFEIFVPTFYGLSVYEFDGVELHKEWSNRDSKIEGAPVLYDIDRNGEYEVIYTTSTKNCPRAEAEGITCSNRVYIRNAKTGYIEKRIGLDQISRVSPAVANLINDPNGHIELVAQAQDSETNPYGRILCYTANTGLPCEGSWPYLGPNSRLPSFTQAPTIADIDNDGEYNVIFGARDNKIYFLKEDGTLLFDYQFDGQLGSSPAIGDIDGDMMAEIAVRHEGSNILVELSGANHQPQLHNLSNISVNEGEHVYINFSGQMRASDEDNDTLTFYYGTPLNESGYWETDCSSAGQYEALVEVSDGNLSDWQHVWIEVSESCDGMEITEFNVTGTNNIQTFEFTVDHDSPYNLTNVSWSINFGDGEYTQDNFSLFVGEALILTVDHEYAFSGEYVVKLRIDELQETLRIKTGSDLITRFHEVSENNVSFEVMNNEGTILEDVRWEIYDESQLVATSEHPFTLNNEEAFTITIDFGLSPKRYTLVVTDGTYSDARSFVIGNEPPSLEVPREITVYEGEVVEITPTVSDPDGDPLILSMDDESFSKEGDTFIWQTRAGDFDNYTFSVIASDGNFEVSDDVEVTVNPLPTSPSFTITPLTEPILLEDPTTFTWDHLLDKHVVDTRLYVNGRVVESNNNINTEYVNLQEQEVSTFVGGSQTSSFSVVPNSPATSSFSVPRDSNISEITLTLQFPEFLVADKENDPYRSMVFSFMEEFSAMGDQVDCLSHCSQDDTTVTCSGLLYCNYLATEKDVLITDAAMYGDSSPGMFRVITNGSLTVRDSTLVGDGAHGCVRCDRGYDGYNGQINLVSRGPSLSIENSVLSANGGDGGKYYERGDDFAYPGWGGRGVISINDAYSIDSHVKIIGSTFNSQGGDAAHEPDNEDGGNGGSGGFVINYANSVTIQNSDFNFEGGDAIKADDGNGGHGGGSALQIISVHDAVINDSNFIFDGGDGSNGVYKCENERTGFGYERGEGGRGGDVSARLQSLFGSVVIDNSDFKSTGGRGGLGHENTCPTGSTDSDGNPKVRTSGDDGGEGGDSQYTLIGSNILIIDSTIDKESGGGGTSLLEYGGDSGYSEFVVSTIEEFVLKDSVITNDGGDGGVGFDGGDSDNSQITIDSRSIHFLNAIIENRGGNGGISREYNHRGGDAADTYVTLRSEGDVIIEESSIENRGGNGGPGEGDRKKDESVGASVGLGGRGGFSRVILDGYNVHILNTGLNSIGGDGLYGAGAGKGGDGGSSHSIFTAKRIIGIEDSSLYLNGGRESEFDTKAGSSIQEISAGKLLFNGSSSISIESIHQLNSSFSSSSVLNWDIRHELAMPRTMTVQNRGNRSDSHTINLSNSVQNKLSLDSPIIEGNSILVIAPENTLRIQESSFRESSDIALPQYTLVSDEEYEKDVPVIEDVIIYTLSGEQYDEEDLRVRLNYFDYDDDPLLSLQYTWFVNGEQSTEGQVATGEEVLLDHTLITNEDEVSIELIPSDVERVGELVYSLTEVAETEWNAFDTSVLDVDLNGDGGVDLEITVYTIDNRSRLKNNTIRLDHNYINTWVRKDCRGDFCEIPLSFSSEEIINLELSQLRATYTTFDEAHYYAQSTVPLEVGDEVSVLLIDEDGNTYMSDVYTVASREPDIQLPESVVVYEDEEVVFSPMSFYRGSQILRRERPQYTVSHPGFLLDANSFVWTPSFDDSGEHQIDLGAAETTDIESFTVTVLNKNRAPRIELDNDTIIVTEGEYVELEVNITDPDNQNTDTSDDNIVNSQLISQHGLLQNEVFTWQTELGDSGDPQYYQAQLIEECSTNLDCQNYCLGFDYYVSAACVLGGCQYHKQENSPSCDYHRYSSEYSFMVIANDSENATEHMFTIKVVSEEDHAFDVNDLNSTVRIDLINNEAQVVSMYDENELFPLYDYNKYRWIVDDEELLIDPITSESHVFTLELEPQNVMNVNIEKNTNVRDFEIVADRFNENVPIVQEPLQPAFIEENYPSNCYLDSDVVRCSGSFNVEAINTSHHLVIENARITYTTSSGIEINVQKNITIRNSTIRRLRNHLGLTKVRSLFGDISVEDSLVWANGKPGEWGNFGYTCIFGDGHRGGDSTLIFDSQGGSISIKNSELYFRGGLGGGGSWGGGPGDGGNGYLTIRAYDDIIVEGSNIIGGAGFMGIPGNSGYDTRCTNPAPPRVGSHGRGYNNITTITGDFILINSTLDMHSVNVRTDFIVPRKVFAHNLNYFNFGDAHFYFNYDHPKIGMFAQTEGRQFVHGNQDVRVGAYEEYAFRQLFAMDDITFVYMFDFDEFVRGIDPEIHNLSLFTNSSFNMTNETIYATLDYYDYDDDELVRLDYTWVVNGNVEKSGSVGQVEELAFETTHLKTDDVVTLQLVPHDESSTGQMVEASMLMREFDHLQFPQSRVFFVVPSGERAAILTFFRINNEYWIGDEEFFPSVVEDRLVSCQEEMCTIPFDVISETHGSLAYTITVTGSDYLNLNEITPLDTTGFDRGSLVYLQLISDTRDSLITSNAVRYQNTLPVIMGLTDHVVYENELLEISLSATDVDSDDVTFSGEHVSGTIFSWTPMYSDVGRHEFRIFASDGFGRSNDSFDVQVLDFCTPHWMNATSNCTRENVIVEYFYDVHQCYEQTSLSSDLLGRPSNETFGLCDYGELNKPVVADDCVLSTVDEETVYQITVADNDSDFVNMTVRSDLNATLIRLGGKDFGLTWTPEQEGLSTLGIFVDDYEWNSTAAVYVVSQDNVTNTTKEYCYEQLEAFSRDPVTLVIAGNSPTTSSRRTSVSTGSVRSSSPSSTSTGGPTSTTSWTRLDPGVVNTATIANPLIAVTQLEIVVENSIENVEIAVSSLESVEVSYEGEVYQYLEIAPTASVNENLARGVTVEFMVEQSWFGTTEPEEVELLRFVNGEWMALPTIIVNEDSDYVYYEAVTPGFSFFAIGVKEVQEASLSGQIVTVDPVIEEVHVDVIDHRGDGVWSGIGGVSALTDVLKRQIVEFVQYSRFYASEFVWKWAEVPTGVLIGIVGIFAVLVFQVVLMVRDR